nr:hypothetical protein [Kineosporia sp. A_224]
MAVADTSPAAAAASTSSTRDVARATVNRSATWRPRRPIRARRSGSPSSVSIAVASAATSPGGTSRPLPPSSTCSGMPPTRLATTGAPMSWASVTVMGSGSGHTDGATTTAARAIAAITAACGTSWWTTTSGPSSASDGVSTCRVPMSTSRAGRSSRRNASSSTWTPFARLSAPTKRTTSPSGRAGGAVCRASSGSPSGTNEPSTSTGRPVTGATTGSSRRATYSLTAVTCACRSSGRLARSPTASAAERGRPYWALPQRMQARRSGPAQGVPSRVIVLRWHARP